MLVFEPGLRGDFLDGELGFSEQAPGANQPEFEQILVGTQAGMGHERGAEPTVTDAELLCQKFHVQAAREFILDVGDGEFDGV